MKRPVLAVLAALLAAGSAASAAELHPLSADDGARVQKLLSGFDPSTYEFLYKHTDAKGKVHSARLGSAVGLGNIRQDNTLKQQPSGAANILAINVFKNASSVNTINVFKVAASAENQRVTSPENPCGGRWFKNPAEQAKANELNAILQKYYH